MKGKCKQLLRNWQTCTGSNPVSCICYNGTEGQGDKRGRKVYLVLAERTLPELGRTERDESAHIKVMLQGDKILSLKSKELSKDSIRNSVGSNPTLRLMANRFHL